MMVKRFGLAFLLLLIASVPAYGWFNYSLETPIDGLQSNSVIDIAYDGQYIWVATDGGGVAASSDGGVTWLTFNKDNAFAGNGVSALTYSNGRLLVATVDTDGDGGGTGLYYTEDHGQNWTLVDNPLFSRIGQLSYDFAAYDSVIYSSNYYGGFLRSLDNGDSWEAILWDDSLEAKFERDSTFDRNSDLRGRSFSTAIDPNHEEFRIVWMGSAEGITSFYFVDKHRKLASRQINDMANDGEIWWYATDRGISRFDDTLFTFNTYDTDNGLPYNYTSSIAVKGDLVLAGLYDSISVGSIGIAVSTNNGQTWSLRTPPDGTGANHKVEDLEFQNDRVWAAANRGGLLLSTDNGTNWSRFYPPDDDTIADRPYHHAHALDIVDADSLKRVSVGTDSGVVALYFDDSYALDSAVHMPLFDNTTWGQKVVSLSTMITDNGDEFWLAVRPYKTGVSSQPAVLRSTNHGATWDQHLTGPPAIVSNDIEIGEFYDDTVVWVATENGIRRSTNFGQQWFSEFVWDKVSGDTIHESTPFNTIHLSEFEMHAGGDGGLGQLYYGLIFGTPQFNYRVFKPQMDPNQYDVVRRSYTAAGGTPPVGSLRGNFVTAMAVQKTGDSSILWAAHRPALEAGDIGVSFTSDRGVNWTYTLANDVVWNFEFNGDTVFAAADEGLFMSTDFGANWDKLAIVDPQSGRSISDSTPVYAVTMIGDELWVGTEDGIAKSENLEDWEVIRNFKAITDVETYITPNPFSPYLGAAEAKFHYKLKQAGNVTITIYDFANNVVKKVTDGAPRDANVQYDDVDFWNGKNERGDAVAAGVYLYLLESTGGDKLWGKIMVIP